MNPQTVKTMFSSNSQEWETPQKLFDEYNQKHNFEIDLAATPQNAKCPKFFTKDDDALTKPWDFKSAWCNPPYGRGVGEWVKKAAEESRKYKSKIVMLLPVRTDTKWFHNYIFCPRSNCTIIYIKGRLKFGGHQNSAPFPSMVVIFNGVEDE